MQNVVSSVIKSANRANLNFTVIDVETANFNRASICQIGLVRYEAGECVREWETYVDPRDYFDRRNSEIR